MIQPFTPFDTIESAQDFLRVLVDTIAQAHGEIAADLERELQSPPSRRTKALQIAAYNLDRLEKQMNRSHRILNDLRTLRRLLFGEREFQRVKSISAPLSTAQRLEMAPPIVAAIPPPRTVGAMPLTSSQKSTRPAIPA